VQVIYLHHVQKSYSVFQVETSQQNLQAVFTGKPHNSWSLNPYFVLFRALDWATDAKGSRIFTLALALRVLPYKVRCGLQQAILWAKTYLL
jgi:hypothetical protein